MVRELPLIAVIDDDPAFVQMMGDILTDEGYRMLCCSHGEVAYWLIQREQPDLIVLDIRMEYADSGWNVLRLIRDDPTMREMPVIVCSVDNQFLEQHEEQLHFYRCSILIKPFDLDDLLEQVKAQLQAPHFPEAA